jgi:hypothetical protein
VSVSDDVESAGRRFAPRLGARRASPLLVALVATLGWALVVAVVARTRWDSDVRALLQVGANHQLPEAFASVPVVGPSGYDGAYYALLATDPLLRRLDTVHDLDAPSYRATRILIPLLAWALALGHASAAIVLYQLLCWGTAIGAVYLLARWLADERRSPWWAIVAAGGAGVAAAIIRTTPDAAALFFMIAALWLHARGRPGLALAAAALAVLTRETSVLAALAIAADELRRRRLAAATAFAAVPAAAGVGWQLYLRHALGHAFNTGASSFAFPFAWLPHHCAAIFRGGVRWDELFGTAAVLATAVALVAVASRPATWRAAEWTFLAFAAMGLFLSDNVYCEAWAYARALVAIPFLAVLIGERQRSPWRRRALRTTAILYLLAGVTMADAEVGYALGGRPLLAALWQGTPASRSFRLVGAAPPGGVVRVARPQPPLWVLPVASTAGRGGAVWRTRLVIRNPHDLPVRVAADLFGPSAGAPARTEVTLAPHESRVWDDALAELFGRRGMGAVRLVADSRQVAAASLTLNATAADAGPLLPALGADRALRSGGRAKFSGLAYDPDRAAEVRTNIGVVNLSAAPVKVRAEAFDAAGHRLGAVENELGPGIATQIDDLFARVGAPCLDDGRAVVSSPTPGAVILVYASVIRGPTAPPTYLYPQPEPAGPR